MRESKIEACLKKQVESVGGEFIKLTDKIGRPDRIALFEDGFYFVEIKSPKGQLSLSQKQEINHLLDKQFKVCVIRGFKKGLGIREQLNACLVKRKYYVNTAIHHYLYVSPILRK